MDGSPVYDQTTTDYDDDVDGLIDVKTLAQLNVIRQDSDGNGDRAAYTGTGTAAASDSGDTYHNSGSGLDPIGGDASADARCNAAFKGNGHTVSNLFIKRTARDDAGLFGAIGADALVENP